MKYAILALLTLTACGQEPPKSPQVSGTTDYAPAIGVQTVSDEECHISGTDSASVPWRVNYSRKVYDDGGETVTCSVATGDVQSLNCTYPDKTMATFNIYTQQGSGTGTFYSYKVQTQHFPSAFVTCTSL